jgi:SRSO17 transposase
VTLSLAHHHASLPVAYRLYLPKEWAEDEDRRSKAGVPDDIDFETKPEIALQQVRWACEVGNLFSLSLRSSRFPRCVALLGARKRPVRAV